MDENKLAEAIVEALRRSEEDRATRAGSPEAKAESAMKVEAVRREEFAKELVKLNKILKDTSSASKTFERVLNDQRATYRNIDEEIQNLNEQYANSRKAIERDQIDKKRIELEAAKSANNLSIAISNATLGLVKLSATLGTVAATATGDFIKGLQRGSSGIELSTGLMTAGVDAVNTGVQGAAAGLGGLGQIASNSTNRHVKTLGLAAQGAGIALSFIGEKSSKLAKFGIEVLSAEVIKTGDAFAKSSSAGAMFSDGLTGLRNAATQAGLRVDQLANVISKQSETLAASGMGVGDATKQLGAVGKVLKTTQLDRELLKLGYGFEEQSELVAEVLSDMRRENRATAQDPQAVAARTREYAENLRVIADITGKDARKRMEESRAKVVEADLYQQAMKQGGPDAVKRLTAQLNGMSDETKKGYMEFVSSGGQAIRDQATNIMASVNPALIEQYKAQFSALGDATMSAAQAQDQASKLSEKTGKYLVENVDIAADITRAARFGGQEAARGFSEMATAMMKSSLNLGEGVTEAARLRAQEQAATPDKFTEDFMAAQLKGQEFMLTYQEKVYGLIKDFTAVSDHMLTELNRLLGDFTKEVREGKIGKAGESTEETITQKAYRSVNKGIETATTVGSVAMPLAGAAAATGIGAIPAAITAAGATIGAGIVSGINEWFTSKEGKATGGIARGSKSGFLEKLHGTEAVVPLPDGSTIPVKIEGNVTEKQESTGFNFTQVLSDVANSFSRAGTLFKKNVMIDNNELAAAFAANKPDPAIIKKQEKPVERTPVDKTPGVLDSLISVTTSAFRNLTRDFVSAKDEVKNTKEKEFSGLTKQVTDLSKSIDTKAKTPVVIDSAKTVEIDKRDIAQLADASRTPSTVGLNEQAVAELKTAQTASVNPLLDKIGDLINSDNAGQLIDSLSRSINRPDSLTDQTVAGLVETMKSISLTRAPKIEIKDLDSLNRLSATMLSQRSNPKDMGAEQCSALIAKYVEQSKNQLIESTKKFEEISKQLLGVKDINRAEPTDVSTKTVKEESTTSLDRLSSVGELTIDAIKTGFADRNIEMVGELNRLVTEIKESLLQQAVPPAANVDTASDSNDVISAAIQNAMREGNNVLKEALVVQADIMRAHLVKIDQLINISSDTKNINQQLLNNTY